MYWRVSDVMTPDVVTASEDAPVGEIVDKLVTHGVSGLPIVDDGDRLVGVVSQMQLKKGRRGDVARRSTS